MWKCEFEFDGGDVLEDFFKTEAEANAQKALYRQGVIEEGKEWLSNLKVSHVEVQPKPKDNQKKRKREEKEDSYWNQGKDNKWIKMTKQKFFDQFREGKIKPTTRVMLWAGNSGHGHSAQAAYEAICYSKFAPTTMSVGELVNVGVKQWFKECSFSRKGYRVKVTPCVAREKPLTLKERGYFAH